MIGQQSRRAPHCDERPLASHSAGSVSLTMLVLRHENGLPKWTPALDGIDGCGVNHLPLQRTTLH